jgi:hypothetical protein
MCANLAAFYSDARTERKAQVTCAEPKHILKPRGAPLGAVKLRQELQSLVGRPHDAPDELKAARDERGADFGDETGTRSFGVKAKNKKRQVRLSKENQAKKRTEKRQKRKRGSTQSNTDSNDDSFF